VENQALRDSGLPKEEMEPRCEGINIFNLLLWKVAHGSEERPIPFQMKQPERRNKSNVSRL